MKKQMIWALSALMLATGMASANEDVPETVAEQAGTVATEVAEPLLSETESGPLLIGVIAVGEVDPGLVVAVSKHIMEVVGCEVERLEGQDPSGATNLIDEAKTLVGLRGQRSGVIALAQLEDGVGGHGAFLPNERVGVLNLGGLRGEQDEVVGQRRAIKEGTKLAGLIIGMQHCPNSRCVMWQYKDEEGLDFKGGAFCPPCQVTHSRILAN